MVCFGMRTENIMCHLECTVMWVLDSWNITNRWLFIEKATGPFFLILYRTDFYPRSVLSTCHSPDNDSVTYLKFRQSFSNEGSNRHFRKLSRQTFAICFFFSFSYLLVPDKSSNRSIDRSTSRFKYPEVVGPNSAGGAPFIIIVIFRVCEFCEIPMCQWDFYSAMVTTWFSL